MQILLKKTILLLLFISLSQINFAQEQEINNIELPKYQIELNGGKFVTDNISFLYDEHIGIDFKYFFKHHNKLHYYLNAGFSFEIETEGANLYTTNISIGSQYDVIKLWKKPLYVELSTGGLYWIEKFSTQLIEGVVESTNSEFGFRAKFGLGYRLTSKINLQLNATQFSSNGTSVGAGISYSF